MFPPLLLGAVVSGAATVGSVVQHYRRQLGPMTVAEARQLARLPVTSIARARDGLVKLVGTVGCDTPVHGLYNPVSVAVREVHYYDVDGRGARARKVLARTDRTTQVFWVEDDTGRVEIDPMRARIDHEIEGADSESGVEEHWIRVGERVAVIGTVHRATALGHHPMRQPSVRVENELQFVAPPLVTWRTEPEVYPRLAPPAGGLALSVGTVCLAVLGAILQV